MKKDNLLLDRSMWIHLLVSVGTIFFAISEQWPPANIIAIYVGESIIIGLLKYFYLLSCTKSEPKSKEYKIITIFGFTFVYLIPYLYIIAIFAVSVLVKDLVNGNINLVTVGIFCAIYLMNHLYSTFYYLKKTPKQSKYDPMSLSAIYALMVRVFPMLLIVGFGKYIGATLIFFLILKTISDLIIHFFEHEGILI